MSGHESGDGCAIYASDYRVTTEDGSEISIADLRAGTVFREYDEWWIAREVARGDDDSNDIHVNVERLTEGNRST